MYVRSRSGVGKTPLMNQYSVRKISTNTNTKPLSAPTSSREKVMVDDWLVTLTSSTTAYRKLTCKANRTNVCPQPQRCWEDAAYEPVFRKENQQPTQSHHLRPLLHEKKVMVDDWLVIFTSSTTACWELTCKANWTNVCPQPQRCWEVAAYEPVFRKESQQPTQSHYLRQLPHEKKVTVDDWLVIFSSSTAACWELTCKANWTNVCPQPQRCWEVTAYEPVFRKESQQPTQSHYLRPLLHNKKWW